MYKTAVGRDDLGMKEHGAVINAGMGLPWAAFTGTQEDAVIAGAEAMLDNEVTSVLKVLRKSGLDVVVIHHHMTGDRPMVIFLHCWGRGPAEKLATDSKQLSANSARPLRLNESVGYSFDPHRPSLRFMQPTGE